MRQEQKIQEEVQLRLKELAENVKTGNKSQRGGPTDVYVGNRVKWPQEYVLTGQSKERVTYNHLIPIQWMARFCQIMREDPVLENRDFMLDYVINLLEDVIDFSWSSAKASHAVLLCRIEQGKIGG